MASRMLDAAKLSEADQLVNTSFTQAAQVRDTSTRHPLLQTTLQQSTNQVTLCAWCYTAVLGNFDLGLIAFCLLLVFSRVTLWAPYCSL